MARIYVIRALGKLEENMSEGIELLHKIVADKGPVDDMLAVITIMKKTGMSPIIELAKNDDVEIEEIGELMRGGLDRLLNYYTIGRETRPIVNIINLYEAEYEYLLQKVYAAITFGSSNSEGTDSDN